MATSSNVPDPKKKAISPTGLQQTLTEDVIKKIAEKLAKMRLLQDDPKLPHEPSQILQSILDDWEPKFPTVALFVRWAKQSARDYNSDSISLLLTLANQANMKALKFLELVKCYRFTKMKSRGAMATPYGFRFSFAANKKKDEKEPTKNQEVERVIQGLKLCCLMLEERVAMNESVMLAKERRSKKNRCDPDDVLFKLGDENDYYVAKKARLRTHLISSFDCRLWQEVEYRFLGFHIVKYIFSNLLGQKAPASDERYLVLSYRLLSNCAERRLFIEALTLMCLSYGDLETIQADRTKLMFHWQRLENDETPQAILEHARGRSPTTNEGRVAEMDLVFKYWRGIPKSKNISERDPHLSLQEASVQWWNCIKANTYRHFLDFKSHIEMKRMLSTYGGRTEDAVSPDTSTPTEQDISTFPYTRKRKSIENHLNKRMLPTAKRKVLPGSQTLHEMMLDGEQAKGPSIPNAELPELAPRAEELITPTMKTSVCQLRKGLGKLRMATNAEVASNVDSELVILHPKRQYHLLLPAFEIYSARNLATFEHGRVVRNKSDNEIFLSQKEVHEVIGRDRMEYIDPLGNLHVVRPGSIILRRFQADFSLNIQEVCAALLEHGCPDERRSDDSFRIHMAAASSLSAEKGSSRPKPVGMTGKNSFLYSNPNRDAILEEIGGIACLVWNCTEALQIRSGQPSLKPAGEDRAELCQSLKDHLFIPDDRDMCFESLTIALMEVAPSQPRNHFHVDEHNCKLPTCSQTGALDIVLVDDKTGCYYLLQFLFNYRRAVTAYCLPSYKGIEGICRNIESLNNRISVRYAEIFAGREMLSEMPQPTDRTGFFLDDRMAYETVDLLSVNGTAANLEVIRLPIGYSRTFSLSSAIHVLNEAAVFLKYDQLVEMCFFASLLNTPVRFYYLMNKLLMRAKASTFRFQEHPFYDWYPLSLEVFQNWQGGPMPRYASAGISDIGKLFPDCQTGRQRLKSIVGSLIKFLLWIDKQQGCDEVENLPMWCLKKVMEVRLKEIKQAVPGIEFASFRLMVFLTLANGCCITLPGKHLRNLFFPTKGTASLNHLRDGNGNTISAARAERINAASNKDKKDKRIEECKEDVEVQNADIRLTDFDTAMRYISEFMGYECYSRDVIECALCESQHSRDLKKSDVLIRGVPVYDIDGIGRIVRKKPGRWQRWEIVTRLCDKTDCLWANNILSNTNNNNTDFLFYLEYEATLDRMVDTWSKAIKKEESSGESQRKHNGEMYQHKNTLPCAGMENLEYNVKFFYEHATTSVKTMKVLQHATFAVPLIECYPFDKDRSNHGEQLLRYIRKVVTPLRECANFSGCVHQQSAPSDKPVFFEIHKDKHYFKWAAIIPIVGQLWTLVAIPTRATYNSNTGRHHYKSQTSLFNMWKLSLPREEQIHVEKFWTQLEQIANKEFGVVNVRVYHCVRGTVLAFPARSWYHATITRPSKEMRHSLIMHPTIFDS